MKGGEKLTTALLGVSGYIGRALLVEFEDDVVGYSRDKKAAIKTLEKYEVPVREIREYGEFLNHEYDVVINATGIGSPKKLNENPAAVFSVTEEMDQVLFKYLEKYPKTRVFNLSSGAVYGRPSGDFVTENTAAVFDVNNLSPKDSYGAAKFLSEVKHRARPEYSIIDLRVFAFVSRYLDPTDSFLVADIARCLKEQTILKTKPSDLTRDFITATDIAAAVKFLVAKEPMNTVFDLKSAAPVSKFELLESLRKELKLKFEVEEMGETSPTGTKNIYATKSSQLEQMGLVAKKTSLQNVTSELKDFLTL